MISYAQNFEDVMLWRVLRHITCGLYVDVGAFHPEIDSVTKWFYDQGWTGINVEPVPDSFALLQLERPKDRNVCAAAGASAGVAQMTVFRNSKGLSSLCPTTESLENIGEHDLIQVQVLPLGQILQVFSGEEIHFLKIDAEGSERDVLLGMDFDQFRPWIILIEATSPLSATRNSDSWRDILIRNNYQPVYFDGLNEFFVSDEKNGLSELFKVPPNVFDDFELASVVHLRQLRESLQNSYETLAAQMIDSRKAIAALKADNATLNSRQAALQDQLLRVSTQLASSREMVDKLTRDASELRASLKFARGQLEQVFRSRSWRWLAPVRKANSLIKSYRKSIRSALS